MPDTIVCLIGFFAYLVFILMLVIVAKNSALLQSGLPDLLATFTERLKSQDQFGAFLAAGLIALRLMFTTGVFSFLVAGFTAVMALCNTLNSDSLKVVREILQDLYKFINSFRKSAGLAARSPTAANGLSV